jgi:hypothetical protein
VTSPAHLHPCQADRIGVYKIERRGKHRGSHYNGENSCQMADGACITKYMTHLNALTGAAEKPETADSNAET